MITISEDIIISDVSKYGTAWSSYDLDPVVGEVKRSSEQTGLQVLQSDVQTCQGRSECHGQECK